MKNHILLSNFKEILLKKRIFLNGSIIEYLLIFIFFSVLTLIYTDFVLLDGTHKLFIEGPGDGTAGFLWRNFVNWSPWSPHTNLVNYPIGENLSNPTLITYSLLLIPLWLFSFVIGPVAGLNLVTFLGLLGCALAMYWLIKRLTSVVPIAVFAGFAATYVPYHIVNSSSHLSYIFSVVFVLIFASLIALWRRPNWRRALLFAATLAIAFYTDGYFILLASVFTLCILLGLFINGLLTKDKIFTFVQRLKFLVLSFLFLVALLVPIFLVQITQSKQIGSTLVGARGDITYDLNNYSARPIDFITPSVNHPWLMGLEEFKLIQSYKNSRSNPMESTLYIGFTLIILCLMGSILLFFSRAKNSTLKRLSIRDKRNFILIATVSLIAMPLLIYWTMPPFFKLFGLNLIAPAGFLLQFHITFWRVMSRFFLPLHVLITVFASLSLYALLKSSRFLAKTKIAYLVCIFIILILSLEYLTMTSRPAYNFDNIPKSYYWLRDQKELDVIAELPLVDRPFEINYNFVTAQIIHKKKLINTHSSLLQPGGRTALGDGIEAVDYSISRGAKAIITHDKPCKEQLWGDLVYVDQNQAKNKESFYYGSPICIYKVIPRVKPDYMFVTLKYGNFADAPLINVAESTKYFSLMYGESGELSVKNSLGEPVRGLATLSGLLVSSPGRPKVEGVVNIVQDNKILSEVNIGEKLNVVIDASKPVVIKIQPAKGKLDLYQIALLDFIVTAQ